MSIYFATSGPYIKIGYSGSPVGRMTTVTRNGTRPDDLPRGADAELVGWLPGGLVQEGILHARFAELRVAGEWFQGIDVEVLHKLIEADPRGVDVQRMTALLVFAAMKYPEATRSELEAAGITIWARPMPECMAVADSMLTLAPEPAA